MIAFILFEKKTSDHSLIKYMKKNIKLPDYLSILEYSVQEINFVLSFYEGTSQQEFVEEEWNEICSLQDAKVRAEKKAQFFKTHKVSFPAKVSIIIKELYDLAQEKQMPLCSFAGFGYFFNTAYWEQIDPVRLNKFLSRFATRCGINEKIAISASIQKMLIQQFHSYASRVEPTGDDCVKINLQNGTLRIDDNSCVLEPFSADDFLRYQLSVAYNENAQINLFQQFLDRVLPEKESQEFLAEYIGYTLTTNIKLEQCLILVGSGANGKSVIFDIVNALLGKDNITHYTLAQLCGDNEYRRATLSGKLLNYSSELGTGLADVDMVKKLISNEPIDARLPYGEPFTVHRYGKFMFNTNSLPTSVEISDAYFRRMNFMQFDVTIPKSEQDPELAKKIIDTELDGVLQWVLVGLKRLLVNRKFTVSPKMEAVKEQIRRDLDSVATFMAETGYKPSPNKRTLLKTLREEYNEFCKLNNCRQVGHKIFSQRLRSAGFDVVSGTGNRTYVCCETTQNPDLDFVGDVFKLKSSER